MNQCILMAEVVEPPQLRYTQENQTAVAEMVIQFPGLRPEEPPVTLKAVGWGNLAQEVQARCQQGDRFIFEGRLRMSTIDRPEGFKEKQAELTISKVHNLDGEEYETVGDMAAASTGAATATPRPVSRAPQAAAPSPVSSSAPAAASNAAASNHEPDYDDIPF